MSKFILAASNNFRKDFREIWIKLNLNKFELFRFLEGNAMQEPRHERMFTLKAHSKSNQKLISELT